MRFSLLISIIQLYVVPNSCKSLLFFDPHVAVTLDADFYFLFYFGY